MTSECNDCIEAYSAKLEKLRNELESSKSHICNAGKFVELVKKFSNTDKLSRELLNTLVDRIEVCEKVRTESSGVVQNINIYYKFVGELNAV